MIIGYIYHVYKTYSASKRTKVATFVDKKQAKDLEKILMNSFNRRFVVDIETEVMTDDNKK